ncbi:DUF2262 domain-containing protein [Escherichia fergusonii]|uniref:DUF2262 domain-containing protein n=1 Tax=Escherichia fergusonii TaxID=564 RepID=UPI0021001CCF|nr:DUF2262 domain-containing protein [Escherichia fergusonii]
MNMMISYQELVRTFLSRINLVELAMDYNGDYSLYYNDDDMFWGHIIDIVGSIETGPTSASIAG